MLIDTASTSTVDTPTSGSPKESRAPRVGDDRPDPTRGGADGTKVGGLVLTRRVGESIMIGGEVEVQVAEIRSGTVRLKFVAPRSVPVHRREVFDSIRAGVAAPTPATPVGAVASRPGKVGGGLVLARSAGQSIMIGEDVELSVIEVHPSTAKLRVSAPKSVAVHRREVFDAMQVAPA